MGLGICSGCRRFARGEACPFCGGVVGAPIARVKGRRMRARLVAPIVAIAVTAGGCGATEKPSSDGGKGDSAVDGGDDDAPATLYGGVPFDAGNG